MKTSLLIASLCMGLAASAQELDSVILGSGYNNESYYSFETGEVVNISNTNWDLAFEMSAFGSTIRMNRRVDVLYLYPGTVSNWATLDTAGHSAWDQYIDGYTD